MRTLAIAIIILNAIVSISSFLGIFIGKNISDRVMQLINLLVSSLTIYTIYTLM